MINRARASLLAVALSAMLLVIGAGPSETLAPPASRPAVHLAPPIATGLHMCSCTHSFHVYVPPAMTELAALAGIQGHKQLATSMIGGSFVSQHWDVPDARNKVKAALATGKVDVLTLSPIYLPDEGIEKFTMLAYQSNPQVRVILQQSWLPWDGFDPKVDHGIAAWKAREKNHPRTVDHNAMTADKLRSLGEPYMRDLADYVEDLNRRLGKQIVFVVPAGQAVQALREKVMAGGAPGIKTQEELFSDALGHPRPALALLVSYCNFAVIYRRSPVGLPRPRSLANISADLNQLLQQTAWDAACADPLSGLAVPARP